MADVADWHFSAARSRFTAQILNEWGAVIVNINERTFPSKPYGKFLLVKPGFRGAIPIDAARIELHSSGAKMLGRVEIKGGPEGAVAARSHFGVQERCIDCLLRLGTSLAHHLSY